MVLVVFVALSLEGLPFNASDMMLWMPAMGLLLGALLFPSSQARFDPHAQVIFLRFERWGYARQDEFSFSEIESLRRFERGVADSSGLVSRFALRVHQREWPLFAGWVEQQRADEAETRLRALLPFLPVENSPPPNRGAELPSLAAQGTLQLVPEGVRVRKSCAFERVACCLFAAPLLATTVYARDVLEPFQKVGMSLLGLVIVLMAVFLDSFEWRFDERQRRVFGWQRVAGFKRKREFDFDAIQGLRREEFTVKVEDVPLERARLFLQVADERLPLSPSNLSLAQADELQNALESSLGDLQVERVHLQQ